MRMSSVQLGLEQGPEEALARADSVAKATAINSTKEPGSCLCPEFWKCLEAAFRRGK